MLIDAIGEAIGQPNVEDGPRPPAIEPPAHFIPVSSPQPATATGQLLPLATLPLPRGSLSTTSTKTRSTMNAAESATANSADVTNLPVGTASISVPTCSHPETTTHGSNQHVKVIKCKRCGVILERIRRTPESATGTTASPSTRTTERACQHFRVTWQGSNGFQRVRKCLDWGDKTTCPHGPGLPSVSSTSGEPVPSLATVTDVFTPQEAMRIVDTFHQAMNIKRGELDLTQAVPASRLLQPFELTITQSSLWANRTTTAPGHSAIHARSGRP